MATTCSGSERRCRMQFRAPLNFQKAPARRMGVLNMRSGRKPGGRTARRERLRRRGFIAARHPHADIGYRMWRYLAMSEATYRADTSALFVTSLNEEC